MIHSRNDLYSDSRCNRLDRDRYFLFFFLYLRARTWRGKKYVIQAIFLASLSQKEGKKEGRNAWFAIKRWKSAGVGEREKEIERHVLPVAAAAAAGVRGTIKNDETRPSDGGNVGGE